MCSPTLLTKTATPKFYRYCVYMYICAAAVTWTLMFNTVTQCSRAQLISLVMWDDHMHAFIIQQVVSNCPGRRDFLKLANPEPWTTRRAFTRRRFKSSTV